MNLPKTSSTKLLPTGKSVTSPGVNKEQLYQALDHQELLGQSTLSELNDIVSEYPFFEMGWILLLKNLKLTDDIQFQSKLRQASIHISNRAKLFELINTPETAAATPTATDSTDSDTTQKSNIDKALEAIEALNNQPQTYTLTDKKVALGDDGKLSFGDWVVYYDNKTTSDTEAPRQTHQSNLIDAFLSQDSHSIKTPQQADNSNTQNIVPQPDNEHENEDIFSETLASIYIKQKQYSKAINIFRKLSLKNPEKSIYFAARIAELEKLND